MAKKKIREDFNPVYPDYRDWPLVWLSQHREEFIRLVIRETFRRLKETVPDNSGLEELVADAHYLEKSRIKRKPWKADPRDQKAYWNNIGSRLIDISRIKGDKRAMERHLDEILEDIISRYAHEIAGNFKIDTYKLARMLVPHGFASLLNRKQLTPSTRIMNRSLHLKKKIHFIGHLEHIRQLAKKGTIVMVPTHSSNLDSILMGWGIDEIGLPPFHYGAGLNLFNIRLFGFFMNRLGAYKVDRRKKNRIYLECLKMFSSLSIKEGVHSLFFPGGTRSRSGQIEDKLKLGLLSTAIEAQRMQLEDEGARAKKVFIVPVVINYPFVLEAPTLIQEHLRSEGRQRYYLEKDELSSTSSFLIFLAKFFTRSSQIALSFGKPLDVFGHEVDEDGNSYDSKGQLIDIEGYFKSEGKISLDTQRESEYTKMLGDKIASEYYRNHVVFASSLIAFVAFELVRKQYKHLDLYELFRLSPKEIALPYKEFRDRCQEVRTEIIKMKAREEVDAAPHMEWPVEDVIRHGLQHLGVFHAKRVLKFRKKSREIRTEDLKLLYFYHNRLNGYGLEKLV